MPAVLRARRRLRPRRTSPTRAERDGDVWRLTGQKVWSSRGALRATGASAWRAPIPTSPKHAGITAFAVDMGAPGVDVRPLRQMNGDAHFSEVFLDDVVVPGRRPHRRRRRGLGGRPHCARERTRGRRRGRAPGLGAPDGSACSTRLERIDGELPLVPTSALRVHAVHREADGDGSPCPRARDAARSRRARPGGLRGEAARQRGAEEHAPTRRSSLLGADAMLDDGEWQTLFLMSPSISIRGGTDEIQRNIVGERVLGLPPEPRVDADRPYRDIPR